MRIPLLLADFTHTRVCKPIFEKLLTLGDEVVSAFFCEILILRIKLTKQINVSHQFILDFFARVNRRNKVWFP